MERETHPPLEILVQRTRGSISAGLKESPPTGSAESGGHSGDCSRVSRDAAGEDEAIDFVEVDQQGPPQCRERTAPVRFADPPDGAASQNCSRCGGGRGSASATRVRRPTTPTAQLLREVCALQQNRGERRSRTPVRPQTHAHGRCIDSTGMRVVSMQSRADSLHATGRQA